MNFFSGTNKIIAVAVLAVGLTACQTTTAPKDAVASVATTKTKATVKSLLIASLKKTGNASKGHGCEKPDFLKAIGAMTSPAQVKAYYKAKGFSGMSKDGSGQTAINILNGIAPINGKSIGKAQCFAFGAKH